MRMWQREAPVFTGYNLSKCGEASVDASSRVLALLGTTADTTLGILEIRQISFVEREDMHCEI